MKIKIENDLFDISSRMREIHPSYEIFFDTSLQKFVLYAKGKQQLVFPFDALDARAIDYARKTSVTRLDELLDEIDKKNERYQGERVKVVQDKIEDEFSRRLRISKI